MNEAQLSRTKWSLYLLALVGCFVASPILDDPTLENGLILAAFASWILAVAGFAVRGIQMNWAFNPRRVIPFGLSLLGCVFSGTIFVMIYIAVFSVARSAI